MNWLKCGAVIGLGITLGLSAGMARAIPGQSADEAAAWILAHPTLRPARGEKFLIRKSDTPARRFVFRVSLLPVGRIAPGGGDVRAEEISIYDMVNGVTREHLEEAIRVIYGTIIYQDYAASRQVYSYPTGSLVGEIREGDRYAYWMELVRRTNSFADYGRMTVFLKSDLPKLQTELKTWQR